MEKEKDPEKENSPTRDWRLAAARVLMTPKGYEDFLAQRQLRVGPPPATPVLMDAANVPNITDDNICCHFVINGITVAQARRWRVWAIRAHCRVDYPYLPTPKLAPPLLPWIVPGVEATGAPTLAGGTPDIDVPMVDPQQAGAGETGSSGGLPPPSASGSGGPGVTLPDPTPDPTDGSEPVAAPPSTQPQ